MINSTFRKLAAGALFLVLGLSAAQAQQPAASSTAKVFGGRAQYRTWSLGFNAGVLAPVTILGGNKDFNNADLNLGYGFTLRKQLGHAFGLEGSFLGGKLSGSNDVVAAGSNKAFESKLKWTTSLMGVANVATVDFLKRENAVNFLVKAGYGFGGYTQQTTSADNVVSAESETENIEFIPVGLGVKFKVSNTSSLS